MLKFVIVSSILVALGLSIELTFELPDNANQCFYEDLKKDVDTVFEFQVSISIENRRNCNNLIISGCYWRPL